MSEKELPDIDVFLSYSSLDEQAVSESDQPDWVTEFRNSLETAVTERMPRAVTVWHDRFQLKSGSDYTDETLDALRSAKVLVVIVSPAYFASESTTAKAASLNELQMFMRFNDGVLTTKPTRVFPVIGQPLSLEVIPDYLRSSNFTDFTADRLRIEPGQQEFKQKISELTGAISKTLIQLENINEEPDPEDEAGLSADTGNTWLCQYRRSEMTSLEDRLSPGLKEKWRISPIKPGDLQQQMNVGDKVVLWRTIDKVKPKDQDKSRGGIVGWGEIHSTDDISSEQRIVISLTHAFPDKPILRDKVIDALGSTDENWPGQVSLKRLDRVEGEVLLQFRPTGPQVQIFHETNLNSDRAETTRDRLGRAPLAFTLAHHINRIWTEQNKPVDEHKKKYQPDEAAFIMHIDSPWGGGKTTFANFVSLILNPKGYKLPDSTPDEGKGFVSKLFQRVLKTWRASDHKNQPEEGEHYLFRDLRLNVEEYWPKKYLERQWITVNFNAWQHQHIDPPWWNFYESMRKQCLKALPFRVRKDARISEWFWRVWSPELRRTLAVALVFLITGYFLWNIDPIQSLVIDLLNDKKTPTVAGDTGGAKTIGKLLLLAFFGGSGIAIIRSIRVGVRKVIDSAGGSTDEAILGTSDPLQRFREHFSREIKRYDRPVMVIVDDLDRCEPQYVVELVRGILTIFRSPRIVFVLLGDKTWIETSFAVVHNEMNKSHRDHNISFGGRFAEKAIQLSFILPKPDESSRSEYIDSLLSGEGFEKSQNDKTGGDVRGQPFQQDLFEFRSRAQDKLKSAESGIQRNEVMATLRASLQDEFGNSEYAQKTAKQIINDEAVLRAASSKRTEAEIRHGISDVKNELPDNPRRIKRIINMISVYQASAQSVLGIDPGTKQWKQLVLWVILISEHPKCWEILSSQPELAQKIIEGKTGKDSDSSSEESPETVLLETLSQPAVVNLIKGSAFESEIVQLDKDAIEKLRNLTPLV